MRNILQFVNYIFNYISKFVYKKVVGIFKHCVSKYLNIRMRKYV